jgi:ACS family pantothenate transporter-like MFS transporter
MAVEEKSVHVGENHLADSASESGNTDSIIKERPQKKWVSYIWDTFDKSPEERRFLFKLDAAVLTFASLGMKSVVLSQRFCN